MILLRPPWKVTCSDNFEALVVVVRAIRKAVVRTLTIEIAITGCEFEKAARLYRIRGNLDNKCSPAG